MPNKLMIGLWRFMLKVPSSLWEKQVLKAEKRFETELGFMTPEHRRVHHFVVRSLPSADGPLPPEAAADSLNLSLDRVKTILDDLEKHMTFLFRNTRGEVVWAYPVTVDETPHHVTFSTGESLHAAWAADAFATPFVQGRLRNEHLSVTVKTECAHCREPMEIEIDSELEYKVKDHGCRPIIFVPDVDLLKLEEDSIIDSFWKKCIFFWSEEHARAYRKKEHRVRGAYLTADQMIEGTKIIQSVIFGFDRSERV